MTISSQATRTRRSLLAAIPSLTAAVVAPGAANALIELSAQDDPICAAIAAVRAARRAFDVMLEEERKLAETAPRDVELYGNAQFAAGHFKGEALYVSSEDELIDVLTKRFMAMLVERGVVKGDGHLDLEDALERPETVWWKIEAEQVRKHFKEKMERRERGRVWREQSGYDRTEKALDDAEAALTEAQQTLVNTVPTTAAGLIALLEWLAEDGAPYNVDDWEDTVFPTIAEMARKILMA